MSKLAGLFNRGGTNTGDVIRQSTSLTMAYLLEQNRKFEAFMRDKVAELEGRVAAQQQTRLDYFDDDETASPEVVEDELYQEHEQEAEATRPLMPLAADVDEPLGLSPAGLPPAGFGSVGAVPVTAPKETVPVEPVTVAKVAPTEAPEPVQAPPSWLVMLGVGEPEPAREEETGAMLDQDPAEMEPEAEMDWQDTTVWEDTTEYDSGEDPADEETGEIGVTMSLDLSEEEPADQDQDKAELEQELAGEENMQGPEAEMPASGDEDESDLKPGPDGEQEEEEPADQDLDESELEDSPTGEEEMDWPEAEMPAVVDPEEAELEQDPDGEQEEAGGTADQDEAEGEAEVELPGEKEVDGSDTDMPAVVEQAESEVEPDPHEGPVQEIDQGPSEGVVSPNAVRMKVRKQGGVLEVGAGTVIGDEEGEVDSLLPPWLTAKLQ